VLAKGLRDWPMELRQALRFCGTASFSVFLKRRARTVGKKRPFLHTETICFLTPFPPKI
jgi:hypothetical protein